MSKTPQSHKPQLSTEELAALNDKVMKKALRNLVIFVGVKVAINYALYRWVKSVTDNN